ncbi:alpha/beta hydrolase [Bacillus tianshenii]|uniref:alpha/beta family hydrolase n=1 Tax=Sutcliffiella tianshenii TaxID=1463404 RepID=UPI001CD5F5CD|nr:alpha/beta family hydrolase [Bacillus tianshenii]MCA1320658.1 alpha/beta hydrolase [Bacillus tianshenii]
MQIRTNSIQGYKEKTIPFTILSKDEGSRSLAIMLPGAGYGTQAPLFHYATGLFLKRGVDVLQVNYQYNDPFYDSFSMEEITKAIIHDVHEVMDQVISTDDYDHFFFVGKSLGTIAMSSELKRDNFLSANAIWLTPLLQRKDVSDAMISCEHKSICMIGDADPCYKEDRFKEVNENPLFTTKLIPDADHALQYKDDVLGSIDILKDVVKSMEQWVDGI